MKLSYPLAICTKAVGAEIPSKQSVLKQAQDDKVMREVYDQKACCL